MEWFALRREATPDMLGLIPDFLSENDPRPAKEQLDANYAHGGGWRPFKGFTFNKDDMTLNFPEDPPMRALAYAHLREELIIIFECAWVVIYQRDDTWEVARLD